MEKHNSEPLVCGECNIGQLSSYEAFLETLNSYGDLLSEVGDCERKLEKANLQSPEGKRLVEEQERLIVELGNYGYKI